MAGYIFNLNSMDALKRIVQTGVYSTRFKQTNKKHWSVHHEGTFADFLSMRPGDNIYFFHKRKIYGVGELISIDGDCIHLNYPAALSPQPEKDDYSLDKMILNEAESDKNYRLLCTFEGSPNFFIKGVDMDEILKSNPSAFRILRAFWKLSFIKIDNLENRALFDKIMKENEEYIGSVDEDSVFLFDKTIHQRILGLRTSNRGRYEVSSIPILEAASSGDRIRHEMAVESAIIDSITNNLSNNIFGRWEYVSHQVIASPFKPIDYMDKIDIFGFRFIPGFETVSKYLMIEIKKDKADIGVIGQSLKYVDWIEQEYCHDYSMIEAFIVARDFPDVVIAERNRAGKRFYTKGRPGRSHEWNGLRLIKYDYDKMNGILLFTEI